MPEAPLPGDIERELRERVDALRKETEVLADTVALQGAELLRSALAAPVGSKLRAIGELTLERSRTRMLREAVAAGADELDGLATYIVDVAPEAAKGAREKAENMREALRA